MQLKHLHVDNFKNIEETDLEFSPKVNCLIGNNGMGKSNLLDAVYYLSFCRSFAGLGDSALLRNGAGWMMLRGDYRRRDADETLTMGCKRGHRKSFKRGGKEYQRLSAHIGAFPLVLISPGDQALITGGGDERRRFVDMIISQSNPLYLDRLVRYTRALEQRNGILRRHDPSLADPMLLEAVESAMSDAATYIYEERRRWVDEFAPLLGDHYHAIAGDGEPTAMSLDSHQNSGDGYRALLDNARQRDVILGYTTVGPHRDDLHMTVNGLPVRRVASQGQCKTYTVAMRLAQYEFLRNKVGVKPLLLLDDIFDKLDADRVERIIAMVNDDRFGQIFITDTNRDHLDSILPLMDVDYRLWHVDRGVFTLAPHRLPL